MYFVVKTELAGYTVIPPLEEKIRSGLLAGLIWTYLMVQGCAFLHEKIRWLEAVGSFSLELYLCHMFVFYRVVNDWLPQQENVGADRGCRHNCSCARLGNPYAV